MSARFVDRQYRLVGPEERAAALDRLARSLARCDWRRCAYALMSNHIHLALLAGEASSSRLLKPLLTAMATCLNRADRTFGPVQAAIYGRGRGGADGEKAPAIHVGAGRAGPPRQDAQRPQQDRQNGGRMGVIIHGRQAAKKRGLEMATMEKRTARLLFSEAARRAEPRPFRALSHGLFVRFSARCGAERRVD